LFRAFVGIDKKWVNDFKALLDKVLLFGQVAEQVGCKSMKVASKKSLVNVLADKIGKREAVAAIDGSLTGVVFQIEYGVLT